mgnify:CR=1 FL=1
MKYDNIFNISINDKIVRFAGARWPAWIVAGRWQAFSAVLVSSATSAPQTLEWRLRSRDCLTVTAP